MTKEFKMQQVGAWWFGSDMMDLHRQITVTLAKNKDSTNIVSSWDKLFKPLIDKLQLEIDKSRLSSSVHMLLKLKVE